MNTEHTWRDDLAEAAAANAVPTLAPGAVIRVRETKGSGRYKVCHVPTGTEARQETGGPLIAGPWAYAVALPSVIDGRGPEAVAAVVSPGDLVRIGAETYSVQYAQTDRVTVDYHNVRLVAVEPEPFDLRAYVAADDIDDQSAADDLDELRDTVGGIASRLRRMAQNERDRMARPANDAHFCHAVAIAYEHAARMIEEALTDAAPTA